jgi:hypothetical protein
MSRLTTVTLGLSPDGQTVFLTARNSATSRYAIWPYAEPGTSWTRQAPVESSEPAGALGQGPTELAASADSDTLVIAYGAEQFVRVFSRSGSSWTQLGEKFDRGWESGRFGEPRLAISADGTTALLGTSVYVRGEASAPTSYVALGDSYSSGEGNAPYEAGTDDEGIPDLCHRSSAAYGPLLDAAVGLGPMLFKACSGAVTADISERSANNPTEPAQLGWLTESTKAVTLTIGGDDVGFASVLEHCVVMLPPIPNGFGCSKNKTLETETKARIAALGGGPFATTPTARPIHSIASVIEAIHATAPEARIVVGLYPTLFGENKATYTFNPLAPGHTACEVGSAFGNALWIGYKDARWLNKLGELLGKAIRKSVETVAKRKHIPVSYAPAHGFVGHAFCDQGTRWFYPVSLKVTHLSELEPGVGATPSSFHPTEAGQLAYGQAFAEKLK